MSVATLSAGTTTSVSAPTLVFVPGGRFKMGAPRGEPGRRANEGLREVRISKPFYIGIREVTNREFAQFRMLLFGVPIGLALMVNGTFLARGLVYGVSPFDPRYMSIAVAFVVAVALLSALLPAVRATRIDPIAALRTE